MKKLLLSNFLVAFLTASFTFFLFKAYFTPSIEVRQDSAAQFINNINVKPGDRLNYLHGDFVETSRKITPAVVNVTSLTSSGYRASSGSGVIISDNGYIITNNHVIEDGTSYEVTLHNKRKLKAELRGVDPSTDLALLKVKAYNLSSLAYGNSDQLNVGEWVLAVGNPFNLNSTVTAGIVSAKARNINILKGNYTIESFIQTDAVVNPGNSGGALVNAKGELIGINTAIISSESGGYEGYSFAIPSNLVKKVIKDLIDYGEVQRAILGISIKELTEDLANRLSLPSVNGIYIDGVTPNSSAANAGLQSGDVITRINGIKTNSVAELQEQIALFRPGDRISLEFYRYGRLLRRSDVRLKAL